MANWYVDSTVSGGNGTTWTLAYSTLAAAASAAAAGDDIWVSNTHNETINATTTITFPGTNISPNRIICVNKASGNMPPQQSDLVSVPTGIINMTGNGVIVSLTGFYYYYGLILNVGSGTVATTLNFGSGVSWGDTSSIIAKTTGSFSVGAGNTPCQFFTNCTFTFDGSAQYLSLSGYGFVTFKNSVFNGVALTNLFNDLTLRGGIATVDSCDLSGALGSSSNIWNPASSSRKMQVINCKLGSNASSFASTTLGPSAGTGELLNSNNTSVDMRNERSTFEGQLTTDTSVYHNSGSSDGTTSYSFKMISTSTVGRVFPMASFQIGRWFPDGDAKTVGQSVTVSIEMLSSALLTNAQVWMDVQYLGTSGSTRASTASSGVDCLNPGTSLPTSSATWNNQSTNVAQTLSCNFTPQVAGLFRVTVKLANPSTTIWVDPLITVS